jgi:hypothetical protein
MVTILPRPQSMVHPRCATHRGGGCTVGRREATNAAGRRERPGRKTGRARRCGRPGRPTTVPDGKVRRPAASDTRGSIPPPAPRSQPHFYATPQPMASTRTATGPDRLRPSLRVPRILNPAYGLRRTILPRTRVNRPPFATSIPSLCCRGVLYPRDDKGCYYRYSCEGPERDYQTGGPGY